MVQGGSYYGSSSQVTQQSSLDSTRSFISTPLLITVQIFNKHKGIVKNI